MSKRTITLLSFAGFFWFLVLVVQKMPAALILENLTSEIEGVDFTRVRGTIWDGEAALTIRAVQPALTLQRVEWQISAFRFLFGELGAHVDIKDGVRHLSADILFELIDHDIEVSDLKGRFDSQWFQPYLNLPFRIDGMVDLDIKKFSNSERVPRQLDGRVVVNGLRINMGQEVTLGTYAADLSLLDNRPVGNVKIQDIDAPLEVSGNVQLNTAMDYYVDLKVKPKSSADELITNTLKNFYRQDNSGFYHVQVGKAFK